MNMTDGAGPIVTLRRPAGLLPAVPPSPQLGSPTPWSAGADRPSALPAALLGLMTRSGVRRLVSPPMWSSRPKPQLALEMITGSVAAGMPAA